jgi:sulfur-oxidizing protein SoxY
MTASFGPLAHRRLFLKGAGLVALIGLGNAVLHATPVLAATNDNKYPEDAFKQKNPGEAIKALYGRDHEASDKIKLDAPEIAENGGVVPIAVTTSLPNVTSISFIVSENPFALAASYHIPEGTVPAVANRLKMAKTSSVIALVESGGKLYSATKEVKVTVGGCGG